MTATEEPDMRILLAGVVGSVAYGLAGPTPISTGSACSPGPPPGSWA